MSQTNAYIRVDLTGVSELAKRLDAIAASVDIKGEKGLAMMRHAVKRASRPIYNEYKSRAKAAEVTGNLAKSTKTKSKVYENNRVVIAITGPEQTGRTPSSADRPSGNHAHLLEDGTPPRRPGNNSRRQYKPINVHQMINGRMRRHGSMRGEDFAIQKTGFYFLMGSFKNPNRQAKKGSGYPYDFAVTPGRGQRPMTLQPGDTYGGMRPQKLMQKTIASVGAQVNSNLIGLLTTAINKAIADQKGGGRL